MGRGNGVGGGTRALAGFRWQFVRTAQVLLELYDSDPDGSWILQAESDDEDGVDYQVFRAPGEVPVYAVEVKASLPGSSTTMGLPELRRISAKLAQTGAEDMRIEGNRPLTQEARRHLGTAGFCIVEVASDDKADGDLAAGATARVTVDLSEQPVGELYRSVFDLVRTVRRRSGFEMDSRACGLVVSALIDLVFDRASTPGRHTLTASDVRGLVGLHGDALIAAIGRRPSWFPLGAPTDLLVRVERWSVSQQIEAALPRRADSEAAVPVVVAVAGPTGTGKSSAVAAWAKKQESHYPVALWVSVDSGAEIVSQVRILLAAVGDVADVEQAPVDRLRVEFQRYLEELAVPWLLVFDGAPDHSTVKPWIPRVGIGDVVVTTVNTTWPPTMGRSVRVDYLSEPEAITMASALLGENEADLTEKNRQVLRELNQEMEGWALGVASACAWIHASHGGIDGVDPYLHDLANVDLSEADYIPDGYPRSGVAAVRRLLADPVLGESADGLSALDFLSAVLACGSQSVPVSMAVVVSAGTRPIVSSDGAFRRADVLILRLRKLGLVERRTLPDVIEPGLRDRISMHRVIATIARSVVTENGCLTDSLRDVAVVVANHSLGALWESGALHSAKSLVTVCAAVVRGEEARGVEFPFVLVLMGNLAKVQLTSGEPLAARDLLEREIPIMREIAVTGGAKEAYRNLVIAHCDIAAATSLAQEVARLPSDLARAVDALAWAQAVDALDDDLREIRTLLADEIETHIDDLVERGRLVTLLRAMTLRDSTGTTSNSTTLSLAVRRMEHARDDAIDLANRVLDNDPNPLHAIDAWGVIAECEARNNRLSDSTAALHAARNIADTHGVSSASLTSAWLNVAFVLCLNWTQSGDELRSMQLAQVRSILDEVGSFEGSSDELSRLRRACLSAVCSVAAKEEGALDRLQVVRNSIDTLLAAGSIRHGMAQAYITMMELYELPSTATPMIPLGLPGVQLITGDLTSDDLVVWCHQTRRGPILAFTRSSPVYMQDSEGTRDGYRELLYSAGLPRRRVGDEIPVIDGWTASFSGTVLQVVDQTLRPWVTFDCVEDGQWMESAKVAGHIWLVYGELRGIELEHLLQGTLEYDNGIVPIMSRTTKRRARDWAKGVASSWLKSGG